jgi:(S)-3,5-dihydroxyphenylglycine transaminase
MLWDESRGSGLHVGSDDDRRESGQAAGAGEGDGEPGDRGCDLAASTLHASLEDPALESMNFLNEVGSRYPGAVSFASGRPTEEFFDVGLLHEYIDDYCRYLHDTRGFSKEQVSQALFQYGRTKGIINELIARQLAADEGIEVDPEALVVTVGCQEAMFIVIRALRADERDVLLAVSPTYVGLTGAARLADMPVWPVRSGPAGVDFADLTAQARRARDAGLRPRACYVMPDFANPSGASLSVPLRHRLLELAARERLLLLEDNPYGTFHDGTQLPTLKSLDTARQVIYLGSFAKTGFPGARVGYAVADQRVAGSGGDVIRLADHLSKIKSMLTVNTSPVAQAVVGGKLLAHDCSLTEANQREIAVYRSNRRQLLAGLASRFADGAGRVSWNSPSGGFFVVVTLPFPAGDELLEFSARQHGVLWTPMRHFYDGTGGRHQARLAYSQLTPELIETGLDRFAALVADPRSRSAAPG